MTDIAKFREEVSADQGHCFLHKAESVITVGNGRGFVMEHRVYFDFGDGNGYTKLSRKVLNTFSEIDGSGPSKGAA